MSIRATVTYECDSPDCHAELVLDATDAELVKARGGVQAEFYGYGWQMDDDDQIHCPQCCEEDPRDEAYERAAARARNNDFADTGGKDWT
jgi:hypothetical protein